MVHASLVKPCHHNHSFWFHIRYCPSQKPLGVGNRMKTLNRNRINGLYTHCRTLTLVLTVQEQPYSIFLAVSTDPGVLHYMSPEIERLSAENILFPVQRQRESQGRICAKFTDLLSYFCALPTKEHLHILKALAPFTLPAQHRRLILADYIQQCNVGGGKEKKKKHKMGQGHNFSLLDSYPYFIVFSLKQSTSTELDFSNQRLWYTVVYLEMITSGAFWTKEKCPCKRTTVNCYYRCSNGFIDLQSSVQQRFDCGQTCN